MSCQPGVRRVIVLVLDGLRADAVHLFPMPNLARLAEQGAATFSARTVTPSVTAAAMTSLFTGVTPDVHGLTSERFAMPRPRATLTPVTQALQRSGLPSSAYLAAIPRAYRGLATRIMRRLAIGRVAFTGENAAEILQAATDSLTHQRRGLILLHWPDADRAGHANGWNSEAYGAAARRLDETFGLLVKRTNCERDPDTLLIVCADHGGGGMNARSHHSLHPLDQRIPLVLLGGRVRCGRLDSRCSLLDIPATVCWALGVTRPATYSGRPLVHAFLGPDERAPLAVAAVA